MKNYLLKILFVFVAVFGTIVFTADSADAQRRGGNRNYNRYSRSKVDRIIKNLENRVDRFVSQFDNSLDNSRLDDTRREDNLNQRARNLESATDELRRDFDRNDSLAENRDEVQRCLNIASDINVAMRNRQLGAATERNWANVRAELNALARVYDLPGVGNAYR